MTATAAASGSIKGVTPAGGRSVVVEEATGTWCPWCPYGTILMDRLKAGFGDHFVGVAIHAGDPMEYPEYNDYMFGNFDLSGYPGVVVNRNSAMHPVNAIPTVESILTTPSDGAFEFGAIYDESTDQYLILIGTSFNNDYTGSDFNVHAQIIENNVNGYLTEGLINSQVNNFVKNLLNDDKQFQKFQMNCHEKSKKFDWKSTAKELENLYNSALI